MPQGRGELGPDGRGYDIRKAAKSPKSPDSEVYRARLDDGGGTGSTKWPSLNDTGAVHEQSADQSNGTRRREGTNVKNNGDAARKRERMEQQSMSPTSGNVMSEVVKEMKMDAASRDGDRAKRYVATLDDNVYDRRKRGGICRCGRWSAYSDVDCKRPAEKQKTCQWCSAYSCWNRLDEDLEIKHDTGRLRGRYWGFLLDVIGVWRFTFYTVFGEELSVDACIVPGCADEVLLDVAFMKSRGATMDF
ncbi:LOW QUALITY PROTEIN: Hypothetical protein PHPALM_20614 [Phytophthora palmivora]|uniref:Uncharacterized protein n=1 Tax=Phytophthora palmivora TaxID=4796 RepID=A0A2P4XEF8_9STRA|nr:LOW QUALITY PROTEIN: Hypothetical protein PHPALM_20614 [Phytophthora palmivora]